MLWIPAFAGMTSGVELGFGYWLWVLAFAGMTKRVVAVVVGLVL
ncbi:hypothetical protein [Winogradskyella ludwigii]|nr:hypothetical protein [Winogradskyella ludwigii]